MQCWREGYKGEKHREEAPSSLKVGKKDTDVKSILFNPFSFWTINELGF